MKFELPIDYEAYSKSLSEFMSVLSDLLLSNANLSAQTQTYILDRISEYAAPITRFPDTHPIFKTIAGSNEITAENAKRVLELASFNPEVKAVLTSNKAIAEESRIILALAGEFVIQL
jgi:hypothetical protein